MIRKNLANITTILGIVLCFIYLWFVVYYRETIGPLFWLAFVIWATDVIDGAIARWLNVVTNFGKLADVIRDKFFEFITFYLFLSDSRVDTALKVIIVPLFFLESMLLAVRLVGVRHKLDLPANSYGKWKMAGVFLSCFLCMIFMKYADLMADWRDVAVFMLFVMFGTSFLLGTSSFKGQIKSFSKQMRHKYKEKRRTEKRTYKPARG